MRNFEVLNIEHFVLYLLPALVFIVLFAAGLGFIHARRKDSDERMTRIIEKFPGGIEGRNAPFPLMLTLTIAGALMWSLLYILVTGLLKVRI